MTDSNGKQIKNITIAAAGNNNYYIVSYTDNTHKTSTVATGIITKWLEKNG